MIIKKLLLAGTALVTLTAGSAMAADLGRPAPAPVYKAAPAPYAYNWSGFYIGGDGGYGWGTSSGTLTTAPPIVPVAPYSFGANGPIAGGFIGGNYQINQFVLGVEGDWQWANLTGNSGPVASLAPAIAPLPLIMSSTVKNYGSLRGRLGVAFDRFLVFGTAGWAWGTWSTSYANSGFAPAVTMSVTSYKGWTAGGGVDYAFTDNLIGSIEYRYTNLGSGSFVNSTPIINAAESGNKVTIGDIRAGLAYKFGGPVAARY